MKRCLPLIVLLLCSWRFSCAGVTVSEPVIGPKATTPGVAAAEAISTITGVAISPLLGVSAVGIWKYYKTPPAQRPQLAWFAQPWFWVPGLSIVLLCFLKDTAGAALPTALKKPLDVVDAFENKISALIAAGAFVPLVAAFLQSVNQADAPAALAAGPFLAALDFSSIGNALMIPISILAFLVVWMAAHAVNILILLSPFTTVDLALKGVRTVLLSILAGTALINPIIGAILSLFVILVSFLVAGWSFRMMIFGTVFAWDLVTRQSSRMTPNESANAAFLATKLEGTPVRTMGRLTKSSQGQMQFEYRPWLVGPKRVIGLATGRYAIGRGLLHPVLLKAEREQEKEWLWFPPRYSGHEPALVGIYNLQEIYDVGFLRGFKAVWRWLKSLCGFGQVPPSAVVQPA